MNPGHPGSPHPHHHRPRAARSLHERRGGGRRAVGGVGAIVRSTPCSTSATRAPTRARRLRFSSDGKVAARARTRPCRPVPVETACHRTWRAGHVGDAVPYDEIDALFDD